MKISKEIQQKMHRLAKLSNECRDLSCEIEEYLIQKSKRNNYLPHEFLYIWRDGSGISLEELENGNDITDQFVEWAENDFQ